MKKLFYVFFVFTFILTFLAINNQYILQNSNVCNAENVVYAKAKNNCILYKTQNTSSTNLSDVYFEVPESYFVTIIAKPNTNCYQVKYKNYIGFCSAENLTEVAITPTNPTLNNITFSIKPEAGTQIRSTPDSLTTTNILTNIPANSQHINYIAKINATTPTGGNSSVWYFAEYTPDYNPTSVFVGYIYSERTTNLTNIGANLEADTKPNITTNVNTDYDFVEINPTIKIVLVALICLPILILFFIGLAKYKKSKHTKNLINSKPTNLNSAFLGNSYEHKPEHRKSIKAFYNKDFYRVSKYNNAISKVTKPNALNLNDLDDDDERL